MGCGCKNRNDEDVVIDNGIFVKLFQIIVILIVVPLVIPIACIILLIKFIYGISTGRAVVVSLDRIIEFANKFKSKNE